MENWRVIRIVLALVAIFALGVVTGHLLWPRSLPMAIGVGGRVFSADMILNSITREVTLTPEQTAEIRPLVKEWFEEAQSSSPRTRERLSTFDKHSRLIREKVPPDQLGNYDRMIERVRRRNQRGMREGGN